MPNIESLFVTRLYHASLFDFAKSLKKLIIITRGDKGAISINGDQVVENDVEKNLNIEDLIDQTNEATKVIYIASPNNPTGTYLSRDKLVKLMNRISKNIVVVIDGAYVEYVQKDDYDKGNGWGHICIETPDVYKACEDLEKLGVNITRKPGPMKHGTRVIAVSYTHLTLPTKRIV